MALLRRSNPPPNWPPPPAGWVIAALITGAIGWTRPRRRLPWMYSLPVVAFFAALRLNSTLGQTPGR